MNRENSKHTYDHNMSPAAKRRALRGKRSPQDFREVRYTSDMSDLEILRMWEEEEQKDWTRTLPSVLEQEALQAQQQRQRIARDRAKQAHRVSENNGARARGVNTDAKGNTDRGKSIRKNPVENAQNLTRCKVKNKKLGILLLIYTVSSVLLLLTVLILNLLPWILYVPLLVVVSGTTVLIRYRYQKGKRATSNFWAVIFTVFNGAVVYYLGLLLVVLSSVSGENTSDLSLGKEAFNVYISGIDTYGDIDSTSRSDVNLIATINPKTGQSLLVTTPRDYYVEIPGVSNGQKDKLTHAGNYGIETSMATLEALYEKELDFYIRVNFSSLIDIIDALGGVNVHSDFAFTTSKASSKVIEIQEGDNYLTGEDSLAFARERYALAEGDAQRGRNHQALLKGIINKLASPGILFNAHSVLVSIGENVETNMTLYQLQKFAKAMIQGALLTNMQTMDAKGYDDRAYCYSYTGSTLYVTVPYESSVEEIREGMNQISQGKVYYKWSEEQEEN